MALLWVYQNKREPGPAAEGALIGAAKAAMAGAASDSARPEEARRQDEAGARPDQT